MILDSHHHLWRYRSEEYGWISPEMGVLARDYSVADLRAAAQPNGVSGSVAVQARQSVDETEDLLDLAERDAFVRGVVGWAPLAEPTVGDLLDSWADRPALCGLRHVVQDEPDDDFLDRPDFNRGVAEAISRGLTYDLLVFPRQLPAAIRFVDRHSGGRFVLDHIAKPTIRDGDINGWRAQLTELARRPHVCCKASGIATEADWRTWTPESIRPYLDATLDAFGADRLMFGSDWPVCLLATGYERWLSVMRDWVSTWSPSEQRSFFASAAESFYRLGSEAT